MTRQERLKQIQEQYALRTPWDQDAIPFLLEEIERLQKQLEAVIAVGVAMMQREIDRYGDRDRGEK